MYDYIALRIDASPCSEDITDLLAAFLADAGYESFLPDSDGLTAYIRKDRYDPAIVKDIIDDFPINSNLSSSESEIEGEDWNKEWEQNYFKPIQIGPLLIRSSFHERNIDAPIEILIDPKMAFGTGHHATTAGMSKLLLEEPLTGKTVIDMGTGTGILAILAKKLGAADTFGIDIDEFAVENARENGFLNGVEVNWFVGDDSTLENLQPSDIFLANINLNVITENLDKYVAKLKPGGKIFLSGFLFSDREKILDETKKVGLILAKEFVDNNWMTMSFNYF